MVEMRAVAVLADEGEVVFVGQSGSPNGSWEGWQPRTENVTTAAGVTERAVTSSVSVCVTVTAPRPNHDQERSGSATLGLSAGRGGAWPSILGVPVISILQGLQFQQLYVECK